MGSDNKALRCFADIVGMAHPYDILIRNVLEKLALCGGCYLYLPYSLFLQLSTFPPLIHEIS